MEEIFFKSMCILFIGFRKLAIMKRFQCNLCGFIYDESTGDPEHGIKAGTHWEDVPEDWTCPECGVSKADFEMVEI